MKNINSLGKAACIGLLAILINHLPLLETQSLLSFVDYLLMFVLFSLVAFKLQEIKSHIKGNKTTIFLVIFTFFFVIDSFMSALEGNFFIENYQLGHHLTSGLIESLILVTAVFILWPQEDCDISLFKKLKDFIKTRSPFSWLMRVMVLLISSFTIYMVLGAMAYPITGPYMEASIKIPSLFENFMIQILRGSGYIIVTLPLVALWDNKRSLLKVLITSYILFYPLLGYAFTHSLPLVFRLADTTVLSLHLVAYTYLFMRLIREGESI